MGIVLALLLAIFFAPYAVAGESAISWNNRGVDLYSAGKYTAAIKAYDRALKLNPRYTDAYSNRGVAYDAMNQPERAVIDYSKAIELNQNQTASFVNRGLAYTDLGKFNEAIADWNIVLKRTPRSADGYYRRGFCYQSLGSLDKALKDFEKAAKLNPRLTKAVRGRDTIRKALAMAPAATEAFTPLPMEKPAQPPHVEQPIEPEITETPEPQPVIEPPAMNFKERQILTGPDVPVPSADTRAHVLSRTETPSTTQLNPIEFCMIAAQHAFGNLCTTFGQYGPAIKAYSTVLTINPSDYFAYYRRGNTYMKAGMKDLALEDYDQVLNLCPKFKQAEEKRNKLATELTTP